MPVTPKTFSHEPPRRRRLNLERLARTDLEALVSYKLWVEVGVSERAAEPVIRRASREWMLDFLGSGPAAIGQDPLDLHALTHARRRRSDILSASQVGLVIEAVTPPAPHGVPAVVPAASAMARVGLKKAGFVDSPRRGRHHHAA